MVGETIYKSAQRKIPFYELEGEKKKALDAYDKCIVNGYYPPVFAHAKMYLEDGNVDFYETLMNLGTKLGIPDYSETKKFCML